MNEENSNDNVVPFYKKSLLTFLTILVAAYPLLVLQPDLLPIWMPMSVFATMAICLMVSIMLLFIIWQAYEGKDKFDSFEVRDLFHSIIVYFLAFGFTKWALLKFLHLHLTTSLAWMEMPGSMMSGYEQVSHFYGQNNAMVIALGIMELSGAILITIRRTRLFGAFILVSICVNILLLNVLYGIHRPVLEAFILLLGSAYIIYLDKEKVIQLLFENDRFIPSYSRFGKWTKSALKISAFVIPGLIFIPNYKQQYKPSITGKYKIVDTQVAGVSISRVHSIDAQYDYVYFDLGDFFSFTSEDFTDRKVGHLKMDERSREFEVYWMYPYASDPKLKGRITQLDAQDIMKLIGTMGEKDIELILHKEEVKSLTRTY